MSDEERKAELAILDLSSVGDRIEVARECMVKEEYRYFSIGGSFNTKYSVQELLSNKRFQ